MKIIFLVAALVASAAADVSHLSGAYNYQPPVSAPLQEYLPPVARAPVISEPQVQYLPPATSARQTSHTVSQTSQKIRLPGTQVFRPTPAFSQDVEVFAPRTTRYRVQTSNVAQLQSRPSQPITNYLPPSVSQPIVSQRPQQPVHIHQQRQQVVHHAHHSQPQQIAAAYTQHQHQHQQIAPAYSQPQQIAAAYTQHQQIAPTYSQPQQITQTYRQPQHTAQKYTSVQTIHPAPVHQQAVHHVQTARLVARPQVPLQQQRTYSEAAPAHSFGPSGYSYSHP